MRSTLQVQDPQGRSVVHERPELLDGLPVADRRLELAGISTAVLDGGDGPPIVLLHGQGEFAATWRRVIPGLARTNRVLAPDLPGHGASGPGSPLDRDHALRWLGELIDATCDEPPILMGHLLGGAIAARFAARFGAADSDRVRHLVLVDSLGLAWFRPAATFAVAMVAFMARPNPRTQDHLFRRCMLDLDGVREDMDGRMQVLEDYALDRARGPHLSAALRRMMPGLGVPPIPHEELAAIEAPTTLVWGRHDLQLRLAVAERASERYGWPLRVIDGARDDPAVEQPRAFLHAVRPLLDITAPPRS